MNTNEWITDRLPNETDAEHCVWAWGVDDGKVKLFNQEDIVEGMTWQPVVVPPMPKRKRLRVVEEKRYGGDGFDYAVWFRTGTVARHIPTREAAERIAAIYEEVLP